MTRPLPILKPGEQISDADFEPTAEELAVIEQEEQTDGD